MGGKVEKYVNTEQDILEKPVKKGETLKEVFDVFKSDDLHKICSITLDPVSDYIITHSQNKWNIIHLACWYNNHPLLSDLFRSEKFDKKFINEPDINLEPPIAICCVVDSVECLKLLDQNGAIKKFDGDNKYRNGLNLSKLCVYHDASKCFQYLNPDLTIESNELDDLYDLAKKNGSDNIAALFEDFKIYEGLESVVEVQEEEPMENINF